MLLQDAVGRGLPGCDARPMRAGLTVGWCDTTGQYSTVSRRFLRALLPAPPGTGWRSWLVCGFERISGTTFLTEALPNPYRGRQAPDTGEGQSRDKASREGPDDFAILEMVRKAECDVATKFGGKQRGGLATGVPESRPTPVHHVVARDGDKGMELLRVPLEGKGQMLPVFSAGWAARGYLFAEAPGGGGTLGRTPLMR